MISDCHKLVGVIPAAGIGLRAKPLTDDLPKALLPLERIPILVRAIRLLRDSLSIQKIFIIDGFLGTKIRRFLEDEEELGVEIEFVRCLNPLVGLAKGILGVRKLISGPFITLLGDEVYEGSNHSAMLTLDPSKMVCGVREEFTPDEFRKNYAVEIRDGRITSLEEKPLTTRGRLMGVGTYRFDPEVFDAIQRTRPNPRTGQVELTDAIELQIKEGKAVHPFLVTGNYFNINTVRDWNRAQRFFRHSENRT